MFLGWCRKPYPDELLYGYVCSVFRKNGFHDLKQINKAINGKIDIGFAVGLPFIHECIENATFPNVDQMVNMLPVYSYTVAECSLQPEKACFPIPTTIREIRVCPDCMEVDKRQYGEVFLHLSHHLNSRKCPVHGCSLYRMCVPASTKEIMPFDKYGYLPCEIEEVNEQIEDVDNNYIWSFCSNCGKHFYEHKESSRRGIGCPYCNQFLSSEEIAQRIINTLYDREYEIVGSFDNLLSAKVRHIPCGTVSMKLRKLLTEKQIVCKECKRLLPQYLQRRFDPHREEWIFQNTDEADMTRRRIKVLHKVCGKESFLFMSQYTSKEGGYCPVCDNPQKTIEISEVDPEYEIESEYRNNRESVQIRHKTCGVKFEVSKTSFLAGARCPICTPRYNFFEVKEAVKACCPGWDLLKEEKRGMVSVLSPAGIVVRSGCSYGLVMSELKAGESTLFPNKTMCWADPLSIRKRIYDRIVAVTKNKGYWNFADGLDEITDSSMPGGVSRERRNIVQDMAKEGFIERCGRGCYRVVI